MFSAENAKRAAKAVFTLNEDAIDRCARRVADRVCSSRGSSRGGSVSGRKVRRELSVE
jgi:hypothetical protein